MTEASDTTRRAHYERQSVGCSSGSTRGTRVLELVGGPGHQRYRLFDFGHVLALLAKSWPSLFALNFVVCTTKTAADESP